MVGYGADPNPCVELVALRATGCVAGNHDHGAIGRLDLGSFNPYARAAALWTASRLGAAHRTFLAAQPLTLAVENATLVHATPKDPSGWDYLMTAEDGFEVFPAFSTRLCFFGHSHHPGVWSLGPRGPAYESDPTEIRLDAEGRHLVNVGSVGQPRDRDPRACYALWDTGAGRIVFHRVRYDIALAREKIVGAGLPRFLGDRLLHGL